MTIVSSVIEADRQQKDGRRSVRERHTDHLGIQYFCEYLAEPGANATSAMNARATVLWNQLIELELQKNEQLVVDEGVVVVVFNYATLLDFRPRIRARFLIAKGVQIGNIAAYLLTFPDANLQSVFNLSTQTQVNQLKTRLTARVTRRDAVLNDVGE